MLAQQDRGVPLLVQPSQQADQLIAGDRVQLRGRLVEQAPPSGRPASAAPSATRCCSPPERSRVERSSRWSMPSASATSSTPRATIAGLWPLFSSDERQLCAHRAHHQLSLGSWKRAPVSAPRRAGGCSRVSSPFDRHAARERTAIEVRRQTTRRSQQRGLAVARESRQHAHLPRLDRQAHVEQRRSLSPGVGVGDALERDRAHGSMPLRSANGDRIASDSTTASASVSLAAAALISG